MPPPRHALQVGLISDTHGLLRPQAVAALKRCAHILHAGDVGAPDILPELARLAPVVAVRGNNDRDPWAAGLRDFEVVELAGVRLYLLHDLADLDLDPVAAGIGVVVCGHSHQPRVERVHGVLYVNPGSAGPRRFKLPISVARLTIVGGEVTASLTELDP
jgi:uncharacterized protein